ncbi:MAG: glycosyltransferase family 39 protein, partial [Planctomycetota bacterium]
MRPGETAIDPPQAKRLSPPRDFWTSNAFAWVLLFLGALLRLRQYLFNRSLWGDECMLLSNLAERSFAGLLQPLSHNQAAPPGFLFLTKTAISAFGTSEYALRLVPLIAGLIALFLFYKVARRALTPGAVPIALVLFAVSEYVVYYASEIKQYETDIACAMLVY